MTDQPTQSVERTNHERPVEPPLPRDGSVTDLDKAELRALVNNVRHVIREEYGFSVLRVYVVGSWARGEAMVGVSDLDLRVVINTAPGVETGEEIRAELKKRMEWTPEGATYPDVAATPLEPDETEPKAVVA